MNINNFEEGTECIKNKKVSLTFFFKCAYLPCLGSEGG